MPYHRLRAGTLVRSIAQATPVPIAKASAAEPPAYMTEFASSSREA